MMKKQAIIITALTICVFVLALLVSQRLWFRLDMTANNIHTISRVSRNLHAEIPDQVTITYFVSDRLRTIHPVIREIEDMLREYAAFSRGRIRVSVRDPARAGVTTMIEELGLIPRQIQIMDRDQASFATVYTGIVIEYMGNIEIIPWVISTATLEYDLTSRIRSMVRETERRIGVLVGDSFRSWNDDFGFMSQALSGAGYDVRLFFPGEEIPDTLPSLIVLGGAEDLDEFALFQIDRFIQIGGRVMFAVSGVYVDTVHGSVEARRLNDRGLLAMIASYGVTIRPELALDITALPLQFQTRSITGAGQFRVIRYPHWMSVLGESGNPEHPVSANFAGLDLFWPSPLDLHPGGNIEAAALFTSTPHAWSMREPFHTNPEQAFLFEIGADETRGTKILGASLSGIFPSFFQGTMPAGESWFGQLPAMPENASPSRIIVVGDTNFATNIISVSGAVQNLDFFIQIADWLGHDDDIIGIRNRQAMIGRLDRIVDPGQRITAMMFAQILNVVIVPLAVIIAGVVLSFRRRSRSMAQASVPVEPAKEHPNGL